jgi:hypothetical protein
MLQILMSILGALGMVSLAIPFALMQFASDIHPDLSRGLVYGVQAKGTTFYFSKINGLIYDHCNAMSVIFIVSFMLCGVLQAIADRKPDPRDI